MILLKKTLLAFQSDEFNQVAKKEIAMIDKKVLPLQQGLSLSSYVTDAPLSIIILNVREEDAVLNIKTGVFYTGIIAGCSCSDDPSPIDVQNEYCELQFSLNKKTAETQVKLLVD